MARISVIISAYNAEAYVGTAVRSVQEQTEADTEMLVVDDASSDRTAATVAALAAEDPRIHLLRARRNGGPGAARNLGLTAATGEWVAVLDADDRFHRDRLRRLVGLGEERGADMVADNLLLCPENGSAPPSPLLPPDAPAGPWRMSPAEFVEGNIGQRGRARSGYGFLKPVIRRRFLEARGIRYRELRFAEDFIFALDCLLRGAHWLVTPEPLYDYSVRAGSLTQCHSILDVGRLIEVYREALSRPAVSNDPELTRAIRRHLRSVELSASWRSFAEAVKERRFGRALGSMLRNQRSFLHVSREALAALPRAVAKTTR